MVVGPVAAIIVIVVLPRLYFLSLWFLFPSSSLSNALIHVI